MFLEVVTRYLVGREAELARNVESLKRQTDGDYKQTFIVDEVGRGIPEANHSLSLAAPYLKGDYIWVLDDDDYCVHDTLVAEMKRLACMFNPDLFMLKCQHGKYGVLPHSWQSRPTLRHIGMPCFAVRNSVFKRHANSFPNAIEGDFAFIDSIFSVEDYTVYWLDKIASCAPVKGNGHAI